MSEILLRSIVGRALRDQRRALVGLGLGVVAFTLLVASLWPTVRDQADEFQKLLDTYPPALRAAFDLDTFDGAGFLQAEMFSLVLPILFLLHAIGRGADLLVGEEERGALDMILVQSVPRRRIVLEKLAGLLTGLLILALVTFASLAIVIPVVGLGVRIGALAGAVLHLFLLAGTFGAATLAIGALRRGRGLAIGLATALAAGSWIASVAARLVPAIEPLRYASAFYYAQGSDPLVHGAAPLHALVLALAILAFGAVAVAGFERRDVGAA